MFLDLKLWPLIMNRKEIWKILEEKKLPANLIKVNRGVYKDVNRIIGKQRKHTFNLENSLKQGDSQVYYLMFIL